MANDYFASKGWLTKYAKAEDSTGAWQKYVAEVQRSEMDNFNTPDLDQGADSILRPGETLEDDFDVTFRKPNAEGGFQQLVQPNNDGSRPGYKGDKATDKVLLERLQAYNDKALQRSSQALYDKYGQDVVDAASKEKFGVPYNEFKPKNDPKGNKRSNFRLKFMSDMEKYGKYISPVESASVGANKRSLDEAKIKLNIIEATKEGNPLNVEQFTKDNNITVKELKKQTKTLQKNIYIKRSLVSGKDSPNKLLWLTDDLTTTDNVLKTLTKQKLIINDAGSIDNIMFNAFGREFEEGTTNVKNPNYNIEKYSAIQKNLSEYRALNKYIDKTYGIKTELDHPLSKKIIRQLMNGTAEDLSRVNILEKNLNQQFKNQLNINYSKAVDSGNVKQKRAIEKIAEKFKLNIGSVPDGQFFDMSKIDRGAPSFETLDIKKEMLKSLDNAASLDTEFLKYIKENSGVFEDAEININKIVKPKNVENIAKNIENIRADLEAKIKELGGKEKMSKLLATGTGSIEERNLIRQVIKTGFDFAKSTGKVAVNLLNPKEFFSLRSLVGKEAMAFMAGVEVVDVADRWIRQGIPVKEALGEKWTKYLMPRSLEEYQTEGMKEANALSSPASKRYAKNIDLSNDLIRTYDKLEMLEKGEAAKIKGTSDVERIANLKKSITAKEKEYSEFINQKDKDGNVLGDGELDFKKDYNEYRAQTKKRRDFTDLNIPFTEIGGMNDMGTDKMSGLQIDRTYTPMYKIGTSKIPSEQELAFDATLAAQPHIRERLIAPSTSKNFNYTPQKLPTEIRHDYENVTTEKGILPPRTSLSQIPMRDGSTYDYLKDLTELYNNSQKTKQASMYPDFHGSQFAEGGLANLMKKYYDKR